MRRGSATDLSPERPDSFFMLDLATVTPKEINPHLEHPFFGLSKLPYRRDGAVRRYESPSGKEYLELQGDPRYGLPTIFDQDFMIYAVSAIKAAQNEREDAPHAKGRWRADKNSITFSAADFADFSRRTDPRTGALSGQRYDGIELGINRLVRTTVATNIAGAGFRRTDLFGILDAGSIVRRQHLTHPDQEGALLACRIQLSDWIMSAINGDHLLKLDRRYFDLRKPFDRRMYQIGRKHCGNQKQFRISIPRLLAKSGSLTSVARFRWQFRHFVERWNRHWKEEDKSLLGYRMSYEEPDGDKGDKAVFTNVSAAGRTGRQLDCSLPVEPSPAQTAIIRAEMPGYDPYGVYYDWRRSTLESDMRIRNAEAALRGFCRARAKRVPRLR